MTKSSKDAIKKLKGEIKVLSEKEKTLSVELKKDADKVEKKLVTLKQKLEKEISDYHDAQFKLISEIYQFAPSSVKHAQEIHSHIMKLCKQYPLFYAQLAKDGLLDGIVPKNEAVKKADDKDAAAHLQVDAISAKPAEVVMVDAMAEKPVEQSQQPAEQNAPEVQNPQPVAEVPAEEQKASPPAVEEHQEVAPAVTDVPKAEPEIEAKPQSEASDIQDLQQNAVETLDEVGSEQNTPAGSSADVKQEAFDEDVSTIPAEETQEVGQNNPAEDHKQVVASDINNEEHSDGNEDAGDAAAIDAMVSEGGDELEAQKSAGNMAESDEESSHNIDEQTAQAATSEIDKLKKAMHATPTSESIDETPTPQKSIISEAEENDLLDKVYEETQKKIVNRETVHSIESVVQSITPDDFPYASKIDRPKIQSEIKYAAEDLKSEAKAVDEEYKDIIDGVIDKFEDMLLKNAHSPDKITAPTNDDFTNTIKEGLIEINEEVDDLTMDLLISACKTEFRVQAEMIQSFVPALQSGQSVEEIVSKLASANPKRQVQIEYLVNEVANILLEEDHPEE